MVLLTKEGIIFYWPVEHNVLFSRVVWIATVFGILFIREIQFVFIVIEHWLIRHVGFRKGIRLGVRLLESSISRCSCIVVPISI